MSKMNRKVYKNLHYGIFYIWIWTWANFKACQMSNCLTDLDIEQIFKHLNVQFTPENNEIWASCEVFWTL